MLLCIACAMLEFIAIKNMQSIGKGGRKLLSENLRLLRKRKGLTQEDIANYLHVVRQTVSKWEKGISVPDADALMRLADLLGVSVSELIGATVEDDKDENVIAQELARINEQMADRNRRSKKILKIILTVLGALLACYILLCFINFAPM